MNWERITDPPEWVKKEARRRWSRRGGERVILTMKLTGRHYEYSVKAQEEFGQGHALLTVYWRRPLRRHK